MTLDAKSCLAVIIPANNEAGYIAGCLESILNQSGVVGEVQVIVAANNCNDNTVKIAKGYLSAFSQKGWFLDVQDIKEPGKVNALNTAEENLDCDLRVYLDADVTLSEKLLSHLQEALKIDTPIYATGRLEVKAPQSFVTRHYSRCWQRLPFFKSGAVGAGLFAVNAKGRKRWSAFPDIISDDTYVRLNFAPQERVEVQSHFEWPMIEGAKNLIRVRRRQDIGVAEIYSKWPELAENEGKSKLGAMGHLSLMAQGPLDYIVYTTIQLFVRLGKGSSEWTRGR